MVASGDLLFKPNSLLQLADVLVEDLVDWRLFFLLLEEEGRNIFCGVLCGVPFESLKKSPRLVRDRQRDERTKEDDEVSANDCVHMDYRRANLIRRQQ